MNPKEKGKKIITKKKKKGQNYYFTCSMKVQQESMEIQQEIALI